MSHLILLGDSIFDNARYVPDGPSVIDQVRLALAENEVATLRAIDGAVADDVAAQLPDLPPDATHLVVSVGGNDALMTSHQLGEPAVDVGSALAAMREVASAFQRRYRAMLSAVLERNLPTAVCTIYDAIPGLGPGDLAGLALFNEIILREAARHSLAVGDLRLTCDEATDYSSVSVIEPSAAGGGKIARLLLRLFRSETAEGARVLW